MLGYAFRVVMNLIQNRSYRGELLRVLVKLYKVIVVSFFPLGLNLYKSKII